MSQTRKIEISVENYDGDYIATAKCLATGDSWEGEAASEQEAALLALEDFYECCTTPEARRKGGDA